MGLKIPWGLRPASVRLRPAATMASGAGEPVAPRRPVPGPETAHFFKLIGFFSHATAPIRAADMFETNRNTIEKASADSLLR